MSTPNDKDTKNMLDWLDKCSDANNQTMVDLIKQGIPVTTPFEEDPIDKVPTPEDKDRLVSFLGDRTTPFKPVKIECVDTENVSVDKQVQVMLIGDGTLTNSRFLAMFLEKGSAESIPLQINDKPTLFYELDSLTRIEPTKEEIKGQLTKLVNNPQIHQLAKPRFTQTMLTLAAATLIDELESLEKRATVPKPKTPNQNYLKLRKKKW